MNLENPEYEYHKQKSHLYFDTNKIVMSQGYKFSSNRRITPSDNIVERRTKTNNAIANIKKINK